MFLSMSLCLKSISANGSTWNIAAIIVGSGSNCLKWAKNTWSFPIILQSVIHSLILYRHLILRFSESQPMDNVALKLVHCKKDLKCEESKILMVFMTSVEYMYVIVVHCRCLTLCHVPTASFEYCVRFGRCEPPHSNYQHPKYMW